MIGKLHFIVLGLTPVERWHAARKLEGGDYLSEQWFILTAFMLLIILAATLLVISRMLKKKATTPVIDKFLSLSDRIGLSRREREILLDIAAKTRLKRKESIFTMVTAFDRGATELLQETHELFGDETEKYLITELSVLREKLGFRKVETKSEETDEESDKPTTRQIPPGKKLHITRRKSTDLTSIESTVVDNNDIDFTVELSVSLESAPGEQWSVRYYFGAAVWEFETSAVNCDGNILVFKHSNNVRFINRRRFLRVPVNKPTYIAQFPFGKTIENEDPGENLQSDTSPSIANKTNDKWGPPEFVRASITELGGPGLRIEAPLEVNVGDRVLVVLMLDEEESRGLKSKKTRIVEDIGQVRHTKVTEGGFSIAVELTGLNESNISELVRVTNETSIKTRAKKSKIPDSMRA